MRVWSLLAIASLLAGLWFLSGCRQGSGPVAAGAPQSEGVVEPAATDPAGYLTWSLGRFHTAFNVYTDADAAGNHFPARGRMPAEATDAIAPPMVENCTTSPHSGPTCIKCQFLGTGTDWAGWYFLNGTLTGDQSAPVANWGTVPNAGVDLTGATQLTFWARGDAGGERVEFLALGVGRSTAMPYPDSANTVTTSPMYVTLSKTWTKYTLHVAGLNLHYVLGGFGWVTDASYNASHAVTFYLDDISYNKPRPQAPRFLLSYETRAPTVDFDMVMRNVAWTYDNALALKALAAQGDWASAKLIADSLVYAQAHDRWYTDGRLRNAYQAGDLVLPPGWTPHGKVGTVRMSGWTDPASAQWVEDPEQVGSYTGNMAWAILALLTYYDHTKEPKYLAAALRLGQWIAAAPIRSEVGPGGYIGGYKGEETGPTLLTWKSTEHNLDVYAAFSRLYAETNNVVWQTRAEHARQFLLAMWDPVGHKFWTGTQDNGTDLNKRVVPLDVQAWGVLNLGSTYAGGLTYAENKIAYGCGFGFSPPPNGSWYEGTAHMAAAYHAVGEDTKRDACLSCILGAKLSDGAIPAASIDGLATHLTWLYYHRGHAGATAWYLFAKNNNNPFAQ